MGKLEHKIQKHQRKRDDNTFYDDDLLFYAIDEAVKNPEANAIIVKEKNGKDVVILRGPNPKSETNLQIVCAQAAQLQTIQEKYREYLVGMPEFEARLQRATGYKLDSFERISFESKEEWEHAWSAPGRDFRITQPEFYLYMSMEVWANDEYWAVLDKLCNVGTHTFFLGHPLWHLSIRRRDEKPLHNWAIIQGIKNMVVGEEFEAIELYPADSRIMDIGNVYHLWILAAKEGETEPPKFPVGAKKPEKGGEVVFPPKIAVMFCTERTKRAFDTGEMPLEERTQFVEMYKSGRAELLIFPDSLMPDLEKEFPGQDPTVVMLNYIQQHHSEVELQRWEPQLRAA